MVQLTKIAAVAAAWISPTIAHPGEKHDHKKIEREIVAREHWAHEGKRSLDACSSSISARRFAARNIERRANKARELRAKRGIRTREFKMKLAYHPSHHSPASRQIKRATELERRNATDLAKWEAIDHNRTGVYTYDANTPEAEIFVAVTSPIFAPSITDGPYYVWGEMLRQNVVEDNYSDGIPLHLEVQYYDIETCQPIPNVYVDIWNANATGVYSGISTSGNYAAGGYNSTYLRGISATDGDGVATFDTIFPGHYDGRATHTHLLAHMNATQLPNNTLLVETGTVTHIGQLFWNEVLRTAVEETEYYSGNTQAVTTNADDMWSVLQPDSSYDPFPEFLYLGDSIEDGLFAWKKIGLNTSADWTDDDYYSIAAYITEDGGYANADSGFMGGGGGDAGGNGTMTGTPPSGTAAPSS
ncbi:Putative intradiol ring-cleavage dioxygenase [Septoria linicola]|uniref:Intradiol ring-cleavage dioxygenase n=1 Tax=Septoria linicola TaxID=215465 RepID=A0A9Q9EJL2_9PEZI|nr:putative intradiol ring-cleavage dioxygenase [Septoria linicola]USW53145.1 Putative intradiol ring-cleavage dioxygenase [Septoria linicola]